MSSTTIEQFDAALARYYKLMGADYSNEFGEYCEENGFDDLAEEMGAGHSDCMLLDFDDDIPFKQEPQDKTKAIFNLLMKIYLNPDCDFQEFDNEYQPSKEDIITGSKDANIWNVEVHSDGRISNKSLMVDGYIREIKLSKQQIIPNDIVTLIFNYFTSQPIPSIIMIIFHELAHMNDQRVTTKQLEREIQWNVKKEREERMKKLQALHAIDGSKYDWIDDINDSKKNEKKKVDSDKYIFDVYLDKMDMTDMNKMLEQRRIKYDETILSVSSRIFHMVTTIELVGGSDTLDALFNKKFNRKSLRDLKNQRLDSMAKTLSAYGYVIDQWFCCRERFQEYGTTDTYSFLGVLKDSMNIDRHEKHGDTLHFSLLVSFRSVIC